MSAMERERWRDLPSADLEYFLATLRDMFGAGHLLICGDPAYGSETERERLERRVEAVVHLVHALERGEVRPEPESMDAIVERFQARTPHFRQG